MCVCVCMCVCLCACVCSFTCTCVDVYVCTGVRVCLCMYVRTLFGYLFLCVCMVVNVKLRSFILFVLLSSCLVALYPSVEAWSGLTLIVRWRRRCVECIVGRLSYASLSLSWTWSYASGLGPTHLDLVLRIWT